MWLVNLYLSVNVEPVRTLLGPLTAIDTLPWPRLFTAWLLVSFAAFVSPVVVTRAVTRTFDPRATFVRCATLTLKNRSPRVVTADESHVSPRPATTQPFGAFPSVRTVNPWSTVTTRLRRHGGRDGGHGRHGDAPRPRPASSVPAETRTPRSGAAGAGSASAGAAPSPVVVAVVRASASSATARRTWVPRVLRPAIVGRRPDPSRQNGPAS
ncbi:hypothetical protein GCM10025868_05760 [Angustibacter aerolatus]|uniref:Uncharacterized protein n=1 Tax=Angustibacter aerolatus TaxID=1162965 RepID=A0ABQ6JEW6_9ACTN|nr:hypothetical protein GCM10025868_05760 [Angustibacter aerolatus]